VVDLRGPEGKVLIACKDLASESADKLMKSVNETTKK